jgi:hypothetical protein
MKSPITITSLLLLALSNLNCQNVNKSGYFEPPLVGRYYNWPSSGIGSPLLQGWQYGCIFLNTGDTVTSKLLDMDCSENILLWAREGKSIVAIDKNSIKGFDIKDSVGNVRNFQKIGLKSPLGNDTAQLYLEVLHAGGISLFVYRKVTTYTHVSEVGGMSVALKKYISEPVYYIRIKTQPFKAIRINKKSIISAFDDVQKIKETLRNCRIRKIKSENQLLDAIMVIEGNL